MGLRSKRARGAPLLLGGELVSGESTSWSTCAGGSMFDSQL